MDFPIRFLLLLWKRMQYLCEYTFLFFLVAPGIKPWASHMLGKCCTTELYPASTLLNIFYHVLLLLPDDKYHHF